MKKCTLCIDRIYNQNLEPEDRVPACVSTCPASARHFGDLGDPGSDISRLVAERGGYDLMPEMGYAPTNKYLPPRPRRGPEAEPVGPLAPVGSTEPESVLLRWLDRALSR
jgi:Fe-S-cluster-containing dehydrogenase component